MTTKLIAVSLAALVATATGALANSKYDPDARAAEQAARIESGRQGGSITYFEGRALRREQQAVAAREEQLRADGRLSKQDRRELKELQNKAADDISQLEGNGRRRWWVLPRVGR